MLHQSHGALIKCSDSQESWHWGRTALFPLFFPFINLLFVSFCLCKFCLIELHVCAASVSYPFIDFHSLPNYSSHRSPIAPCDLCTTKPHSSEILGCKHGQLGQTLIRLWKWPWKTDWWIYTLQSVCHKTQSWDHCFYNLVKTRSPATRQCRTSDFKNGKDGFESSVPSGNQNMSRMMEDSFVRK